MLTLDWHLALYYIPDVSTTLMDSTDISKEALHCPKQWRPFAMSPAPLIVVKLTSVHWFDLTIDYRTFCPSRTQTIIIKKRNRELGQS
jgi:hypothetical protein